MKLAEMIAPRIDLLFIVFEKIKIAQYVFSFQHLHAMQLTNIDPLIVK